jgi:hypothetical protein
MTLRDIKKLQKDFGFDGIQQLINSGTAWKMEGSIGRSAMNALESGACYLPTVAHFDAYGNRVPSRKDLKDGTKGTALNSKRFWSDPNNFDGYED